MLRILAGFVLVAVGLAAGGVAVLLVAGDEPVWAAGAGLLAAGGLVGGGKLIFGREDGAGADGESPPADGDRAYEGDETGGEPDADGSRGIAGAIGAATGAVLGTAINLWALLWLGAFAGAALYFGSKTLSFVEEGAWAAAAVSGAVTLLLAGGVGHRLFSVWRRRREERRDYTAEPGAYRSAWASPRHRAGGWPLTAGVWRMTTTVDSWGWILFGALFNWGAVVGFAVFVSPVALVPGFLFVATALWMTAALYQGLRHRLRYDPAVFTVDEHPARLGGTLGATIRTHLEADEMPDEGLHVVVGCYRRKPGLPRESSRYETIWYAERRVVPDEDDPTSVSASFELPGEAPPSTLARLPERVVWRLEARADELDPTWEQHVEVPVFPPVADAGSAA